MSDLVKKVKKEFLKIFGGGLLALSALGCSSAKLEKKVYVEDPRYYQDFSIIDVKSNDVNYRMIGVLHTGWFMDECYEMFNDYIKNCSFVISEASPEDINNVNCSEEAREFFGAILELAKKYNKKVIGLDPLSEDMILMEDLQCILGMAGLSLAFGYLSRKKIKRKILKIGAFALGTYLITSAWLPGIPIRQNFDKHGKYEYLFYNGVVDQRNIEITERILSLDRVIPKEQLKNGSYVLAIFGDYHAKGFDFYTDHPNFGKFKSILYTPTYNLSDSDVISKFTFKNGYWWKEILEK